MRFPGARGPRLPPAIPRRQRAGQRKDDGSGSAGLSAPRRLPARSSASARAARRAIADVGVEQQAAKPPRCQRGAVRCSIGRAGGLRPRTIRAGLPWAPMPRWWCSTTRWAVDAHAGPPGAPGDSRPPSGTLERRIESASAEVPRTEEVPRSRRRSERRSAARSEPAPGRLRPCAARRKARRDSTNPPRRSGGRAGRGVRTPSSEGGPSAQEARMPRVGVRRSELVRGGLDATRRAPARSRRWSRVLRSEALGSPGELRAPVSSTTLPRRGRASASSETAAAASRREARVPGRDDDRDAHAAGPAAGARRRRQATRPAARPGQPEHGRDRDPPASDVTAASLPGARRLAARGPAGARGRRAAHDQGVGTCLLPPQSPTPSLDGFVGSNGGVTSAPDVLWVPSAASPSSGRAPEVLAQPLPTAGTGPAARAGRRGAVLLRRRASPPPLPWP
jgi:hypothetical protein